MGQVPRPHLSVALCQDKGSLHARGTKPYLHITVPSLTRHRTSPPPRFLAFAVWGLTRANITSRPLRNHQIRKQCHARGPHRSPTVVTPLWKIWRFCHENRNIFRNKLAFLTDSYSWTWWVDDNDDHIAAKRWSHVCPFCRGLFYFVFKIASPRGIDSL
jgi:hypothetical protein